MRQLRITVHYESQEAYEEYDANIESIIKDKLGEKGAENFQPLISPRVFPPIYFTLTSFEVPDDVSEGELQEVELGEGVATNVESTD